MSSPETLLQTVLKETFCQAIGRGPTEKLQDALIQDRILQLFMKKEVNKDDTVVAL